LASLTALENSINTKAMARQAGVLTFFDGFLLAWLPAIRRKLNVQSCSADRPDEDVQLFGRYAGARAGTRLIGYAERAAQTRAWVPLPWELDRLQFSATQGLHECLSWRGLPLFKSVFDLALYPMLLWNIRPANIIELGSGLGGSALWFADMLRCQGTDGHVYSIDCHRPALEDPDVSFVEGDCDHIEFVLQGPSLDNMSHPWIVVEDVHVNTIGILRHMAPRLQRGDYIIVEDSRTKQGDLAVFDSDWGGAFSVDTWYTDFFGRNMTCSADAIFVWL